VFTEFNPNSRAERLTGAEGGAIVTLESAADAARQFFLEPDYAPVANVTLSTTPSLITRTPDLGSTISQGVEVEASGQLSNSVTVSGGYNTPMLR